ncbi:hypothetical protein, partial [Klebsiella pneumoniae]|uniref:hypothetical protein n=1 Tax=Klebsiella pneumoniae TaxID=573 RepID=UPI003EE1AF7A
MAKLNVKFSKEQIDKLMNGLGATFQQQAKKREKQEINEISTPVPEPMASPTLMTLIVPVFEQGGKTYWFEDDNNWFSFW